MKPSSDDFVIAFFPPVASITLGQLNHLIGMLGGLLGIAYLLWKWRKESKQP